MRATKIIGELGVVLTEKEFQKRIITDQDYDSYVIVYLENGVICHVPLENWDIVEEDKNGKT